MQFIDDLPPKSQIFDHWKNRFSELGFSIDWREPGCWACGFHYDDKYDLKHPAAAWSAILDCWDKVPLQRCHIVPRSLGGTNGVANLFLMCRECHDLAPNTSIPELFFEWARSQYWLAREGKKIQAALDSFGVGVALQEHLRETIVSKDFVSWMAAKGGLHRPQSNYAPRSSRLTYATIVGLALHYQRVRRVG